MLPFTKILCPTDFTELSVQALDAAAEIASHFNARLYVLHVLPPVLPSAPNVYCPLPLNGGTLSLQKALMQVAEQKLSTLVAHHVPHTVATQIIAQSGDATLEILRTAEKEEVDLIVMATHGTTGWQRVLRGSVTEEEVRLAPCPVLALHASEHEPGITTPPQKESLIESA